MAKPPTPLDTRQQIKYDELFDVLGKDAADEYAKGISPTIPTIGSTLAPVTLTLAPPIRGIPVGQEPSPTPLPSPRTKLLDRDNLPTIRLDQGEAAQRAIEVRTITKQRGGMAFEDAKRLATEEIDKLRRTPRSVEYGAPRVPYGASELAVRGEELLPKMGRKEVIIESLKPQVLESGTEAAGRLRFDRAKANARERLGSEAKRKGITLSAQADFEAIDNSLKANRIAQAQFGTAATVDQVREIEAGLNAPLYAAVAEFKGTPPGEVVSKFATDTLRGLLQDEKYGRLVETTGGALIRNLGGLTRVGVEALRTPIEALTAEAAARAAGVPGIRGSDLRAAEALAREEGPTRAQTPGVAYEPSFSNRVRLETGDFVKDVAYQVATGRSAIDDWYDTGIPKGAATVLGLVTELGLPLTPAGWVTDVPRAFGAGKAVSAVGRVVGAVGPGIRLNALLGETVTSANKLGFAMGKPTWWKSFVAATDTRVTTATHLAEELGDAAALERALKAGINGGASGEAALVKALQDAAAAPSSTQLVGRVLNTMRARGVSLGTATDVINSDIIQKELSTISNALSRTEKVPGEIAPDILRNTYAAALRDTNAVGETSERAVRAAIAETLEKVPDSDWAFITPRLAVRKKTIADPNVQADIASDVSAAARANPDMTLLETQRVVEETIKSRFKGTSEPLAEPVSVAPPRVPDLYPDIPRGGLERIATSAPRRVEVIEFGQDVIDTARALVPPVTRFLQGAMGNPITRVSDTFAGSSFTTSLRATLEGALTTRIPIELRDFIETTTSQINSLGKTVGETSFGGSVFAGGPVISAFRKQGGLSEYFDARIAADFSANPQELSVLDMPAAYAPNGAGPKFDATVAAMSAEELENLSSIVEKMTRGFFGPEGLAQVLDSELATFVQNAARSAVARSPSGVDAVALAVSEVRGKYPLLKGYGRISAGSDDIASSVLEYIINSEAKVIWGKNFDVLLPGTRITADDVLQTFAQKMDAFGLDPLIIQNVMARAGSEVRNSRALQESIEGVVFEATKRARIAAAIDFLAPTPHALGALRPGLIGDLIQLGRTPTEQTIIGSSFVESTVSESQVNAALQFAAQNRILRAVDETDVMQFLADGLKLPLTSTERKIMESLLGPLDDLAKGSGAIADNLTAVYRSPRNGLGFSFTGMARTLADLLRSASRSGLTVGTIVPNIKYHATNYLSTPFLLSLTSPGLALKVTASEFLPFIGDLGATNGTWVARAAGDPITRGNVAFTSKNGIPYTYGQLNDFMSSNHFGMTQSVNDFGNQFADDVRIAIGVGPDGKSASLFQKSKDRILQFWNLSGTNYSTAFANATDTGWRKNVFLAALKSGESPEVARSVAMNATLDYGRIPSGLRTQASRYMTFFSWFAVSNSEAFGALFRPAALEAVVRTTQAQRTFHRGWGEWDNADDDFKKRIFSIEMGEYDDTPTFFVGPGNPSLGPLISQGELALGMYSLMMSDKDALGMADDAMASFAKSLVESSFTPELGYLKDIGLVGEGTGKGKMVPWRQAAWHTSLGPEHMAAWMADNGVTTVDPADRRLGDPMFYGAQYKFKDDAARRRASAFDAIAMFTGLGRALNDYGSIGLIALPPDGVDMKRYENMTAGILQYFSGGSLKKGTNDYELTRRAIEETTRELREVQKEK